jgi:hypothetical protein
MRRFVPLDETTRSLFPKPGIEVQVSVEPGREWEEVEASVRGELVRIARRWSSKLKRSLPETRTEGEPTGRLHQDAPVDWVKFAEVVCRVLVKVYRENRGLFETGAARRGVTVEQLTAASITQLLREIIEGPDTVSGQPTTLSLQ